MAHHAAFTVPNLPIFRELACHPTFPLASGQLAFGSDQILIPAKSEPGQGVRRREQVRTVKPGAENCREL